MVHYISYERRRARARRQRRGSAVLVAAGPAFDLWQKRQKNGGVWNGQDRIRQRTVHEKAEGRASSSGSGSAKGKLYLEFGGKLFDDYHAARVLPGFDVNAKIKLLYELREMAEIIFVVSAGDIEKRRIRADLGITYDMDNIAAD